MKTVTTRIPNKDTKAMYFKMRYDLIQYLMGNLKTISVYAEKEGVNLPKEVYGAIDNASGIVYEGWTNL